MVQSNRGCDDLYATPMGRVSDFIFDQKVADVFPDMINRSVPGYATIIRMIGLLAAQHVPAQGRCYDLGCSLGAAALAMSRSFTQPGCRVIAVDNSVSMLTKAKQELAATESASAIDLICADVRDVKIHRASMVVLNFTLQFIPVRERLTLLQTIFDGLEPGGLLVLSEKIAFEDQAFNDLFIGMHHQFKRDQGYSELEISQKRSALENVLIPESLSTHQYRLQTVGFQRNAVWFQCFNFLSMLAVKACPQV